MIVEFECRKCGTKQEFNTEKTSVEIMKTAEVSQYDVYVVKCNDCGIENKVQVKRSKYE